MMRKHLFRGDLESPTEDFKVLEADISPVLLQFVKKAEDYGYSIRDVQLLLHYCVEQVTVATLCKRRRPTSGG